MIEPICVSSNFSRKLAMSQKRAVFIFTTFLGQNWSVSALSSDQFKDTALGNQMMDRRQFMNGASAAAIGGIVGLAGGAANAQNATTPANQKFSMHFAPHLGLLTPNAGMFRCNAGNDPVDQVRFMAERGFTAMEDNWMTLRDVGLQQRIGRELERLEMRMGVIVNTMVYDRPTYVLGEANERERLVAEVRATAEVARRVGATHVTTLSGTAHPSLPRDYQTANMIENLKWTGEAAAKEGIVLAVEPINLKGWPGTFLTDIPHGYMIVKCVDMPSVRLLYDFWHQQIHGGDLLPNLDLAWDVIGYFQIADNPGRFEPGVGEINYRPIMRRIAERGFSGVIGMEFDNSRAGIEGEEAVISAMRSIDPAHG